MYQNDSVRDDNYYEGTYEIYNGTSAENYIVNDLSEYGIEQDELDEYYTRNQGDSFYKIENLFCMKMSVEYTIVDGEEWENGRETFYYGFADGTSYDMANLSTGNYLSVMDVIKIEEE
jgi:hypothetical protein